MTSVSNDLITILMAEDDPDDRNLVKRALTNAGLPNELRFVENGEELLAYLRRQEPFADTAAFPYPDLVLLDLNMPRKDGRAALQEIRGDESLKHIPVVALTTSREEEDILRAYRLGVNSYITKPVTFQDLVSVARILGDYWFQIVKLPPKIPHKTPPKPAGPTPAL